MNKINFHRLSLELTVFLLILGFLSFSAYGGVSQPPDTPGMARGAPDKKETLSHANEQITLLYIDALNFYREGNFRKAADMLEKIIVLLKSDPYVYSVRKSLEIEPTEETLLQTLKNFREKDKAYQYAKKAFDNHDYANSKKIFLDLKEDLPGNNDILMYINRIEEIEARQKLKEEQRKKAALEKQLKAEQEAKKKEELLAKQREEEAARQKKLLELARQREEEARRLAAERTKRLLEEKAKQDMRNQVKMQEEKLKQELRAKKEMEAKEKELAREKQLQELLKKKEEQRKKIALEKQLKAEQEAKKKEELLAKQREEEAARQKRLAELARQREELAAKERQSREQLDKEFLTKKEAAKEKQPAPLIEQQVDLTKKEELSKAVTEKKAGLSRGDLQEKALSESKLNKQKEDQAKIEKIEKLWVQARQLYRNGMYEEAVKYFQEIIRLEGNPRIKYTPYAKEYIEKAQAKIAEKKEIALSQELENVERSMIDEVVKRQIPSYVEPPVVTEKPAETVLIEPPAIRKKLKKKISLDFDKVDLKSLVLFLSQESDVNFIASQKVLDLGLKVSARFNDTPVDEVIKYVTKSLGLVYRIDKDIVWIAHPEEIAQEALETRIYYLNRGGGLFTEFSPISAASETGLGGSSSQINKVITIEDTLKEAVSWPQDAKITYDKRLNALIVRNTPSNLQMLEDILYNLDVTPIQVLIEARFLEVDVTDTKELGLTWKFANEDFPAEQKGGSFKHGIGKDSGVDFSAFSRASEGLNLTYKGLLTAPQFETVLHALEETKKIKTLSSPRITTLNNQMATIKVVDEWIYPTRYEYEIVQFDLNGDGDYNDAGETTYKNVPKDFLRRDVGILLKVVPAVGADKKTITLSLIPEVSEATADGFTYTGDVKLPKFTSRNLSTTVVVTSGETVVLGGLIKESRTKTTTKVPVLGDIPLLGAFFKKNADSIQRKNLLIFVTAKVLSSSGEEVVVAQK